MALVVSSSMGSEELARLWEARPNIASGGLPGKWRFSLAILLHFLNFVFNHNGFVANVLEVSIIHVEQLELNVIIQPIREHVLLLLIRVDVIWGVSGKLDEWVEVLIHIHAALLEVSELLLVLLHSAMGHKVGTETSLKLIPRNWIDVCMSIAVCLPPICYHPKELVCGKKNFLAIHALGDHELLLYPLEPVLGVHGIISLREGGGASSQKFSQPRLVRWLGRRCLVLVRLLVGLHVVESLQHNLHQIVLSGNQLLKIDGVVGVGMVGLAVAHIVPCVHHLTGRLRMNIRFYGNPNYMQ
jgi:hypothetical protein